jgi:hypothetical protein
MTQMLNDDHPERKMAGASKEEKKDSLALPFELSAGNEIPRRTSRRPSPMHRPGQKPPGLEKVIEEDESSLSIKEDKSLFDQTKIIR